MAGVAGAMVRPDYTIVVNGRKAIVTPEVPITCFRAQQAAARVGMLRGLNFIWRMEERTANGLIAMGWRFYRAIKNPWFFLPKYFPSAGFLTMV